MHGDESVKYIHVEVYVRVLYRILMYQPVAICFSLFYLLQNVVFAFCFFFSLFSKMPQQCEQALNALRTNESEYLCMELSEFQKRVSIISPTNAITH